MGRPPSHTEINQALNTLKVEIDTDEKELKKKYLNLVRMNHPDKGGDEEKMKSITSAYNLIHGLSKTDKKQYKDQFQYNRGGPKNPYQTPNQGNKAHHAQQAYDFQNRYQQQYGQNQRPFHEGFGRRSQTYGDPRSTGYQRDSGFNPFGQSPAGKMSMNISRQPLSMIIFRAFMVYLLVSMTLTILWRAYRDFIHDAGWESSANLQRHERLEDILNYRQDQREAAARDPFTDNSWGARKRREEATNARLLGYADKRQQELQQVDRMSWPTLRADGVQGQIYRYPTEPIGVTHYAPPRKRFVYPTHPAALVALPGNLANMPIYSVVGRSEAEIQQMYPHTSTISMSQPPNPTSGGSSRHAVSSNPTHGTVPIPPPPANLPPPVGHGGLTDSRGIPAPPPTHNPYANRTSQFQQGVDPSNPMPASSINRMMDMSQVREANPVAPTGPSSNALDAMSRPGPSSSGSSSGTSVPISGGPPSQPISRTEALRHVESTLPKW